jgi:hypothetical protein
MAKIKKLNKKNIFDQIYKKFFFIGKLNLLYLPIIFGIIFYFYSLSKSSSYSTEIWLTKSAPIFKNYFNKFSNKSNISGDYDKSSFEYIFISKITSEKNFEDFLNSYNKIQLSNDNKRFIKKSFSDFMYGSNNFNLQNVHNLEFYKLEIKFIDYIDGSKLLNDYVQFTIKEVLFYLIKISEMIVVERINITQNTLDILDGNYDLLNPSINREITKIIKNLGNDNIDLSSGERENLILVFNSDFFNRKLRLYNKDLSELKKIYKENSLQQVKIIKDTNDATTKALKDNFFYWNPILRSQNNEKKVNHLNYFIRGMIFGLMIYLCLITFKIIIQRNIIK